MVEIKLEGGRLACGNEMHCAACGLQVLPRRKHFRGRI